jgi:hypothetical protein
VHIAPEAFNVSSAEFPDQIDVWESALPDGITLESVRAFCFLFQLDFSNEKLLTLIA